MITVDQKVKDSLNKNYSINMNAGIVMDINLNTMVNFDSTSSSITGNTSPTIKNQQPFKKLFPLDSIVKPFRPMRAGVKYAISGDITSGAYGDPKNIDYSTASGNKYRLYYPSSNVYYKYWVSPKNENPSITLTYNRTLPTNKIVVKFELSHATPSSWTLTANGGTAIKTGTSVPTNGVLEIYYTGTTWSTSESDLSSSALFNINSLTLTATNPGGYIGIIEVAPHWQKDITSKLVNFKVTKESSRSTEDILPVGDASANSLEVELTDFNQSAITFKTFNKYSTDTVDTSKIYVMKNVQLKPYLKMYHADGTATDSSGTYFKIPQGTFYLDRWTIQEYGQCSLFALDSAKILQEVICPDMVCEDYSAAAIIRRMLDSVGYTNYNFNYTGDDKSIIAPRFWWSDGTQTVWENIKDLCRDTQMSAVVDEYDVLQIYTREYVFNAAKETAWQFRNTAEGDLLPNIIDITKTELPTVNQIKILYNSAYIDTGNQNGSELGYVDEIYLTAAEILSNIPESYDPVANPGQTYYMQLKPVAKDDTDLTSTDILQSFSGYLLIDSEIIEYDAIQYQYQPIDQSTLVTPEEISTGFKKVNVTGKNDILKYKGLAKISINSAATKYTTSLAPTGKYRIKSRGALGTKKVGHIVNIQNDVNGWQGWKDVSWKI
jgi:hypothetical protein